MKKIYKGFSFKNYTETGNVIVYDIEAIKNDIINHIFTSKGERVKMPNFGTIIPDVILEEMSEINISKIKNDILKVINYDPRVSLNTFIFTPRYDSNTIDVKVELDFVEFDLTDEINMKIEFNN